MLIELPLVWILVLNFVAWAVWSVAVGYVMHRVPAARFAHDTWLTRLRPRERDGRWYERRWRIKAWKDRLPEAGALFAGGFSKRDLRSRDPQFFERFVVETRRAEVTHWVAMALAPVFVVWNPAWVVLVMAAYAVLANGPCLVVQRYNRARLERVLARLEAPAVRERG